jgi:hypothetical protein
MVDPCSQAADSCGGCWREQQTVARHDDGPLGTFDRRKVKQLGTNGGWWPLHASC